MIFKSQEGLNESPFQNFIILRFWGEILLINFDV